ncbi:hypothetical protein GWI33_016335 [Rhynchophorus ferrugineus]|uniref:Uncharacterized protein n=1 Tax=Rhynchophorus ferrugineus TaxID=354439 RepID=A0A834I127_RHYFE|nr:hypothetical protein GWI33_016335 [Rhynchophorus ferrugineus]
MAEDPRTQRTKSQYLHVAKHESVAVFFFGGRDGISSRLTARNACKQVMLVRVQLLMSDEGAATIEKSNAALSWCGRLLHTKLNRVNDVRSEHRQAIGSKLWSRKGWDWPGEESVTVIRHCIASGCEIRASQQAFLECVE